MTASVTERAARGGSRFLAVQVGRRILLTFPLSEQGRALATDMALEANSADESQLPAIITRYSAKKADLPDAAGDPEGHSKHKPVTAGEADGGDGESATEFADLSEHPRAVKPIPPMISAKEPELLPKPRPLAIVGGKVYEGAAAEMLAKEFGAPAPETANADDLELTRLLQAALKLSRQAQSEQAKADASHRVAVFAWQKYHKALEAAGVDPTILAEAQRQ